jgi:hypothetical protein
MEPEKSDTAQETPEAESNKPSDAVGTVIGGETESADSVEVAAKEQADPYEGFEAALPEDSKISAERMSEIVSQAKERGLPPNVAQELINAEHQAIARQELAQANMLQEKRKEWVNALKSDPVYGGDNWNATVQLAKRGVQLYADDEMKNLLGASGLGDHHTVIKHFARLGKKASEAELVLGASRPAPVKKSIEEILYGGNKG